MSKKELLRRSICRFVLIEAWKIFKRSFISKFADAVRLAWRLVRSRSYYRYSKVKGLSFGNRQQILRYISQLHEDDVSLGFIRDTSNKFDTNAIKILIKIKSMPQPLYIGYMDKRLAAFVSPLMDEGRKVIGLIEDITGLHRQNQSLGMNYRYYIE